MENGQQEFQYSIPLGRTWSKLQEAVSQRDRLRRPHSNHQRLVRLLEVRKNRIRENQATIQAIEEQLTQTGHTQMPSGSQEVGQTSSPEASHRLGTKSHHSSQSQEVSRRRQGYKGKNRTSFNQRQRDSDTMIHKLLDLVNKVHKNQK
ncbi:hypothetical protein O181_114692 [Austropuccinia psidii MF-1]|uniref:Uncharacterized protein n=1 Tax=Austropuccinia psidii MF-1 TaxID=1389203 RepID=A0A9Q3K626_9BASI|nr:hypothetical protein [Austropuccinia psidii MF-1]